jgi:hypothetical protein
MAKRGRKALDVRYLTFWEQQWHQAFHHLREGRTMPSHASWWRIGDLERGDLKNRLKEVERMSAEEYWNDFLRRQPLLNDREIPFAANAHQAQRMKADEIHSLTNRLVPKKIRARQSRADIWKAIWIARSVPALVEACGRWKRLGAKAERALRVNEEPEVDQSDYTMSNFPVLLLEHAKQFLEMKRNARFPLSENNSRSDDSRLDYLARGMAGIMIGCSPITAIERLRNMKHGPGGPCWIKKARACNCWRCAQKRANEFGDQLLESIQEEGPR